MGKDLGFAWGCLLVLLLQHRLSCLCTAFDTFYPITKIPIFLVHVITISRFKRPCRLPLHLGQQLHRLDACVRDDFEAVYVLFDKILIKPYLHTRNIFTYLGMTEFLQAWVRSQAFLPGLWKQTRHGRTEPSAWLQSSRCFALLTWLHKVYQFPIPPTYHYKKNISIEISSRTKPDIPNSLRAAQYCSHIIATFLCVCGWRRNCGWEGHFCKSWIKWGGWGGSG